MNFLVYFTFLVFTFGKILATAGNVENPLILTNLIKSGKITEAREKSQVAPFFNNTSIVSNSGFLTVNQTVNANLFFWFFQKTGSNWKSAPVVLWLDGGPGCSSMLSAFTENGPYEVLNGKITERKYPWTNGCNMLYIDNPVRAGFSFADHDYFATTEETIVEHLYEALNQFFQLYPELRRNDFYIAGESYAGKYIPGIAYKIHESNPSSESPIALKGMMIGNGFSDPENMLSYTDHIHRLGLIDYKTKSDLNLLRDQTTALIRNHSWNKAFQGRNRILTFIKNATKLKFLWDYMYDEIDDDAYVEFLSRDQVRKAIHVGNIPIVHCSQVVRDHLVEDIAQGVRPLIENLLENYPMLFFSGMVDIQVAHFLTTNFIDKLHWSGAEEYSKSFRQKWYVDDHLAGYVKTGGNLKYASVRDAGHMVGYFQPKCVFDLMRKFIDGEI